MASLSPGPRAPTTFAQILPGEPASSTQAVTHFTFRWKRYVVYISGKQLNILRSPKELVQAVTFEHDLVAVLAEGNNGKLAAASVRDVWVLEPRTSDWNQVSWARSILLSREDAGDQANTLSWGDDGELLIGGSRQLSLFSTLPSSRQSSPDSSISSVKDELVEERKPLWSKAVSSPVHYAAFSPSAGLIASCGLRDRLVKIWRRLSFEEGLFDHAYLPHQGLVTHLEWRTPDPSILEEDDPESQKAKTYTRHEEEPEVLYTMCSDGQLRVWRGSSHADLEILTLHASIDLVSAIPQSPVSSMNGHSSKHQRPARFGFILPAGPLSAAISAALGQQQVGKVNHSIEHLKEVSSKHPDVVVTLDGLGRMSAWGFQSVGHKRRPSTPSGSSRQPFHIAHAESLPLVTDEAANVRFQTWFDGVMLNVVMHCFEGEVSWWQGNVEQFLSPSTSGPERIQTSGSWSGSTGPLVGLKQPAREIDPLISWTSESQLCLWGRGSKASLSRRATSLTVGEIYDAVLLPVNDIVCAVDARYVTLWDQKGNRMAQTTHQINSTGRLALTPLGSDLSSTPPWRFLLANQEKLECWIEIISPNPTERQDVATITVKPAPAFPPTLDDASHNVSVMSIAAASHPRKVGWTRLSGISKDGVVVRQDISNQFDDPKEACSEAPTAFQTDVPDSTIFVANGECAAVVSSDSRTLVIVDLKEGYIEYQQSMLDVVQHLRFCHLKDTSASGAGENGLLAVGYADTVQILARSRYERINLGDDHHNWTMIKTISIAGLGLEISDVAWIGPSTLAVAAGSSMFVADNKVRTQELTSELRDRLDLSEDESVGLNTLMPRLKGPVAIWNPRILRQLSLGGQLHTAVKILSLLEEKLRFHVEGDELHPTLEMDPLQLLSGLNNSDQTYSKDETFDELKKQLDDIDLPLTSRSEQARLKMVLHAVIYVKPHLRSLDDNAAKYLFFWRLHLLGSIAQAKQNVSIDKGSGVDTSKLNSATAGVVPVMGWREIAFAYHSDTQQPLLEILNAHHENKMSWYTVRRLGITSWLRTVKAALSEGSELASLEQFFESAAQSAYRSTQPPDPAGAALFYVALRKKATLLALWRVATGNREQRSTMNFLKRDFTLEENKTAARKNAYALMGKRRFEYAAAFFLLADDADSAVRVLAAQCDDLPLAVAVARVYSGDESPLLKKLLTERVIPTARKAGDRWLLSWAHEIIGQRKEAAHALIAHVTHFKDGPNEFSVRKWEQDDPSTLLLYRFLRDAPKKPSSGKPVHALGIEHDEYRAVLRAARVLRRMGMWLVALELVSNWKFQHEKGLPSAKPDQEPQDKTAANGFHEAPSSSLPEKSTSSEPSAAAMPRSMLDDFEAPVPKPQPKSMLDDFEAPAPKTQPTHQPSTPAQSDREAKAAELLAKLKAKKQQAEQPGKAEEKKPPPTQFKEPEADSILNSFGF